MPDISFSESVVVTTVLGKDGGLVFFTWEKKRWNPSEDSVAFRVQWRGNCAINYACHNLVCEAIYALSRVLRIGSLRPPVSMLRVLLVLGGWLCMEKMSMVWSTWHACWVLSVRKQLSLFCCLNCTYTVWYTVVRERMCDLGLDKDLKVFVHSCAWHNNTTVSRIVVDYICEWRTARERTSQRCVFPRG